MECVPVIGTILARAKRNLALYSIDSTELTQFNAIWWPGHFGEKLYVGTFHK